MNSAPPSKKPSTPGVFLALCYLVTLLLICFLTLTSYVESAPPPPIAGKLFVWMFGSALIAGTITGWRMNNVPPTLAFVGSAILLAIGLSAGLVLMSAALIPWTITQDGGVSESRWFVVRHVIPSEESLLAVPVYVGVSYVLTWALVLTRHNSQVFKVLSSIAVTGGLILLGDETVQNLRTKQDSPVQIQVAANPPAIPHAAETDTYPYKYPAATQEEHVQRLQRDCDTGNGKACLDLVFATRRLHDEAGEQRVYTQTCQRNVEMELSPCVELLALLSFTLSREAAIDEVCGLGLIGCKILAQLFEDNRTARYAFQAHRLVCQHDPESTSCSRMLEMEPLIEPELAPANAVDSQFHSCSLDPDKCLEEAKTLALQGWFDRAAPTYAHWCRFKKFPLEDCSMWLELARWRTYFTEIAQHLKTRGVLSGPVQNARELSPIVTRTCANGDGFSCFFLAVLMEIDHPTEVEEARPIYQRACDLGYRPGCTNALSISSRHRGNGLPLPVDADIRYNKLCFEENETEACSELGLLMSRKFERAKTPEREPERPRIREVLTQTCQREVLGRVGDKVACRELRRLTSLKIL